MLATAWGRSSIFDSLVVALDHTVLAFRVHRQLLFHVATRHDDRGQASSPRVQARIVRPVGNPGRPPANRARPPSLLDRRVSRAARDCGIVNQTRPLVRATQHARLRANLRGAASASCLFAAEFLLSAIPRDQRRRVYRCRVTWSCRQTVEVPHAFKLPRYGVLGCLDLRSSPVGRKTALPPTLPENVETRGPLPQD